MMPILDCWENITAVRQRDSVHRSDISLEPVWVEPLSLTGNFMLDIKALQESLDTAQSALAEDAAVVENGAVWKLTAVKFPL